MRKTGLSDAQIRAIFIKEGKMGPLPKTPSPSSVHPAHTMGNDGMAQPPIPEPQFDHIDEDVWEQCLLRLVNNSKEITPAICDKIRDYLDKKDKISKPPRALMPPRLEDLDALID